MSIRLGLSDRKIDDRLDIGIGTFPNQSVSMFGKLGVHSRVQELVFAVRHGVVEIG